MPEISRFYGIIIRMFYDDHDPAHFHAYYGKNAAKFAIDDLRIISGKLPKRAVAHVLEWAFEHRQELKANWETMVNDEKPRKIKPLK